jgi:hypothetical protein
LRGRSRRSATGVADASIQASVEQLAHTPGLSLAVSNINTAEPQPTKDDRASFELDFMGQLELSFHHELSREIAKEKLT